MKLDVTIVWQKNWDAIHKVCETCNGKGHIDHVSCSWCGDGIGKEPETYGSGKHWRYIINRGSSRSSKTYSLIDCYDLYARANFNKRLTVWRDTKKACVDTVLQDLKKHLKSTNRWKLDHEFHETTKILTYKTGSTFEICGTDDEEIVHGFAGSAAWFNEPYKISRETFDQIDQRTSDFIFTDDNPKKGHWVEDLVKNKRTIVIHSTFKDNKFCPAESRKKILSYQPVSMCALVLDGHMTEVEAMEYDLASNPKSFTGSLFSELVRCRENHNKNTANAFNWSVYGLGEKAERPNRIFRWDPISIEEYRKLELRTWIGCDWGKVDPWAIVEAKYLDGCLYVRELNYLSENDIRLRMHHTELAQISGDEDGIVTYQFAKIGVAKNIEVVCDSNRPSKIAALRRHGWQAFGANKVKGSIIDGIDILHNLRVCFTSDSENISFEQENYSYDIGNDGAILEEPEDINNHTIDAIRYIALYLHQRGIIKKL